MSRRRYTPGPHIYPRGKVYYLYTPERPKGVSLGTTDEAEATRQLGEHLAGRLSLTRGDRAAPAESRLIDILEAFIDAPHGYTRRTRNSMSLRLAAWCTWCAAPGRALVYPAQITAAVMDAWVTERSQGAARSTINRDLRAVKVAFRWAIDRGMCAPNAALTDRPELREPRRTRQHFVPDPAEMRRILASLDATRPGPATAVRVLYATGLRIEELRRLTAFDVREHKVFVRPEAGAADTAEPTKGYRERAVPIAPEVEGCLRAFFAWRSRSRRGHGCSERWLLVCLAVASKAAGVETCTVHDLRRAFATECARAGIELVVIAQWLGHRLVSTTERYIASYRSDAKVRAPVPGGLRNPVQKVVRKDGVVEGGDQ